MVAPESTFAAKHTHQRFRLRTRKSSGNLLRKFRKDNLVGVESQHPVGALGQVVEGKVELGRIVAPRVVNHLGAEAFGNRHGFVAGAGIDHENAIGHAYDGANRPGNMAGFILGEDDGGEGHVRIELSGSIGKTLFLACDRAVTATKRRKRKMQKSQWAHTSDPRTK